MQIQLLQLGIDSFAAASFDEQTGAPGSNLDSTRDLLERIESADQVGLDVFGVGEHHRREFLDSAIRFRASLLICAATCFPPIGKFGELKTIVERIVAGRTKIEAIENEEKKNDVAAQIKNIEFLPSDGEAKIVVKLTNETEIPLKIASHTYPT